jgi:hypothetical protein
MKKKFWLQVLCTGLVLAGILLPGCATSRLLDKKSAKAQEQSVLQLGHDAYAFGSDFISINGKPVRYGGSGSLTLVIPAGEQTVLVNKSQSYMLDTRGAVYIPYTLKSYTTFEFEPNKIYVIRNNYPYLRYNGRTLETSDPGVTVYTSQAGIVSVDNPNLEIKEVGTMPFSTHIGYESQVDGFIGWTNELLPVGFGMGFGVSVIHGKLEMKLLGEAGAGIGFGVPAPALRGGYLVYGGGLAEVFFSKTALEFGGGMIAGNNGLFDVSDSPPGRNFAMPYLKAGFLFQNGREQEWGLYGQYFLNSEGEEWYNKFGIGVHYHSH